MITLRLPHPFGVYCTCTPVELTLLHGDHLGFWGPVWYNPGASSLSFERKKRKKKKKECRVNGKSSEAAWSVVHVPGARNHQVTTSMRY
jgi:hypothetical protein